MAKTTKTNRVATDFTQQQKAVDLAKNEKIKAEKSTDKLDPSDANNASQRSHKTDVSRKKNGGGKQLSPGS